MLTHMKTTVELSDELMRRVKRRACEDGTTFKTLLENALCDYLRESCAPEKVAMQDGRFHGQGYQDGVDPTNWEQMRSLIYEGHGG